MKRRTAFLSTSAGTIATDRPKSGFARMLEAQERDRAIDLKAAHDRNQAGGAAKPRE